MLSVDQVQLAFETSRTSGGGSGSTVSTAAPTSLGGSVACLSERDASHLHKDGNRNKNACRGSWSQKDGVRSIRISRACGTGSSEENREELWTCWMWTYRISLIGNLRGEGTGDLTKRRSTTCGSLGRKKERFRGRHTVRKALETKAPQNQKTAKSGSRLSRV